MIRKEKVYAGLPTAECVYKMKKAMEEGDKTFRKILASNEGFLGISQSSNYNFLPVLIFSDTESLEKGIKDLATIGFEVTKNPANNDVLEINGLSQDIIEKIYKGQKKEKLRGKN